MINEFGCTGRRNEIAESGLMYYRARYYDPEIGRFISQDAYTGGPDDARVSYENNWFATVHGELTLYTAFREPHRFNRYAYVNNNPTKFTDPTGNVAFLAPLIAWGTAVMSSPDLSMDMQQLSMDLGAGNYIDAAIDAVGVLTPGVSASAMKAGKKAIGELHHIASNKSIKSGFTKAYKEIFEKAGMTLNDAANKVFLFGHKGAHTKQYKQYVLDRLEEAVGVLTGEEYKKALLKALEEIKVKLKNNPRFPYKYKSYKRKS